VQVLEGRHIGQHHDHRADDIMTVIRIAEEFHYRVLIHHSTELYLVANELAKRHIPVTLTIIDSPGGKQEGINYNDHEAATLEKTGVKVAINTDDDINSSRFILREAGLAVRGGMMKREP
jgi:imidazolonepropionase-like amidohydrolase